MGLMLLRLILLLTALPVPKAHLVYPKPYVVTIDSFEKKSTFSIHNNAFFEVLHEINERWVLLPCKTFLCAQASFVEPFPGEKKQALFWHILAKKTAALSVSLFTFTPALISLAYGMTIRALEHKYRPFLQYLQRPASVKKTVTLDKDMPLHIAAFNVSFTPTCVNIKMDLRPPVERAIELAHSILNDSFRPEVLMIEEGWHEEALEVFCTLLSQVYPHIIYHVAPHIFGMSSGIAVFSEHEIEEVKFMRFENMIPFHSLPPRGVLRVRLATTKGPLYLYGGIHTQSMDGFAYAQARLKQLKQLENFLEEDKGTLQVIMGDLNICLHDLYGQKNPTEKVVLDEFHSHFDDLFLKDHDSETGLRTKGKPLFLEHDNKRMHLDLPEPVASWYDGPFTQEPYRSKNIKTLMNDCLQNGFCPPEVCQEARESNWGTNLWFLQQNAQNPRYDYIAIPKKSSLDGRVEIRRIVMESWKQSPSSDHLPVHALIWMN